MTKFKKLFSLLVAAVMVACLGSGVFAGDDSSSQAQFVHKDRLTGIETTMPIPLELGRGIKELPGYNPNPTISPYTVIGPDGRTEMSPYDKRIITIEAHFSATSTSVERTEHGTGFMVGNELVATAGHMVYNRLNDSFADKITVTVKTSQTTTIAASVKHSGLITDKRWINYGDGDYDYGLIELSAPLNPSAGYFSLRVNDNISLKDANANITGYIGTDHKEKKQVTMNGKISTDTSLCLFYDIDTEGGQSGAPIREADGFVTGIHGHGDVHPDYRGNYGVKISQEIISLIRFYQ